MTSCLQCGHEDQGGFAFCPRCGTRAVEAGGTDPLLGRTLNAKYRIESQIGRGAMGTVYLGEHIGLRKRVALKVLHPELRLGEEALLRFQREGIAAGKFNHPHAIQIFDFDRSEGGVFYLAMEYVDGVNLTLFLRQRGRLPVEVALRLGRQLCSCLAEAHRHGIVHRDLKPDNIMVVEDARGDLRLKMLDFGLSKLVDRRMESSLVTQPGRLLGTPLYMAPEQVVGEEADARSDVYAAGLILYEMLAGERPFREENTTQLLLTRATREAPSIAAAHPELSIPSELDELLRRALERDRDRRFQSAEEMLLALDESALGRGAPSGVLRRRAAPAAARERRTGGASALAASPEPPALAGSAARRVPRGLLVGILLAAGLLVVAAGALLFNGGGLPGKPVRVRLIAPEQRSELERRYLGLLDEARVALQAGDAGRALTSSDQALLFECRDAEALLVRAEVYRARGDTDTALADLRAAAESDPSYLEPLLELVWILLERGDLAGAEAGVERAAALAGDPAEVAAARGALFWRRGEREAARALLSGAVQREPSCAEAQLYLGRVLLDARDAADAIEALVQAKRNDSRSVQALTWLAEAYLEQGRPEEAEAQLEQALRIDPSALEARVTRAALLLERGRHEEAARFLAESLQREGDEPRLWILRGVALEAGGNLDGAIGALQRGFELGARDPEARCLLGVLQHRKGRLSEAIATYRTVLEEVGDMPLANLDLGLALFAQGEHAEAAQRLERVLAFEEENGSARYHLGLLYKDYLDDPARAVEHFRKYQELGGQDARVPDWIDELE